MNKDNNTPFDISFEKIKSIRNDPKLDDMDEQEYYDMMRAFETFDVRARIDRKLMEVDGYVPDTFGAESFFMRTFITPDMEADFPYIARDFFKRGLKDFNPDLFCFLGDNQFESNSFSMHLNHKILNMIYSMAKNGNAYSVSLMKYLYQTYYRKEYKILKRFSQINLGEIMGIADDVAHFGSTVARILCMCQIYGIKIHPDCHIAYLELKRTAEERKEEDEYRIEILDIDDDLFKECLEQLRKWMEEFPKNTSLRVQTTPLIAAHKLVYTILKYYGFSTDFVLLNSMNDENLLFSFATSLALLKMNNPKKEYTFAQVQQVSLLMQIIDALCSQADVIDDYTTVAFGIEPEFEPNEKVLFDPSKIVIQEKVERKELAKPKVITKESPNQELINEINRLRQKLHIEEEKSQHFKQALNEQKSKAGEISRLESEMEMMQQELIALRDHVYQSTEQDSVVEKISEEEMASAIAEKKIVIVGGHSNWIYKLKNQFKNWIFLSPKPSGSVDGKVLENADYVYFFTEFIKHSTYYKYVNITREKGIPFGYIHSVNVSGNIRKIYNDTLSPLK